MLNTLGPMLGALYPEGSEDHEKWKADFNVAVNHLQEKYNKLIEDETHGEAVKNNMNALAKGIPAFSSGVANAVKGFQNGNPFLGSAGVIDAVSSIITTVASMSSAAGPPGAIVGAILSVISMILKLFSHQKPAKSVMDLISEALINHEADTQLRSLLTLQNQLEMYMEKISPKDESRYTLSEMQIAYNLQVKHPSETLISTKLWLENPENQEAKIWGGVLAAQCLTYVAFLQSRIAASRLVLDSDKEGFNLNFVSDFKEKQLEFLRGIKTAARNRGTVWVGTHYGNLRSTDVVISNKPFARWEDYLPGAAEGLDNRMQSLVVTTIPQDQSQAGESAHPHLAQFSLDNTNNRYLARLPKNRPFTGLTSHNLRARLGQTVFKPKYGKLLKPIPGPKNKWETLSQFPSFYDVYAIPQHNAHRTYLYSANGTSLFVWEYGSNKASDNNKDSVLVLDEISPANIGMGGKLKAEAITIGQVRAVFPAHHPQEKHRYQYFDSDSKIKLSVVYGACEVKATSDNFMINATPHEYVNKEHMAILFQLYQHTDEDKNKSAEISQRGSRKFILSPWQNFTGITTDAHFLWVYRAGAIACATHDAIYKCIADKTAKPDWMIYNVPHSGITSESYDPETNILDDNSLLFRRGILDLAACDDGTLTAIFANKSYSLGESGSGSVYTITPKIDLQKNELVISGTKEDDFGFSVPTSGWKTDNNMSTAYRVVKHPIYCWPLLAALIKSLEDMDKVA